MLLFWVVLTSACALGCILNAAGAIEAKEKGEGAKYALNSAMFILTSSCVVINFANVLKVVL